MIIIKTLIIKNILKKNIMVIMRICILMRMDQELIRISKYGMI